MKKRQKNKFFCGNFLKKNRRGIASEFLPWLIIAIAVLAIVLVSMFLLKDKGNSLVDQIKNLFSFGG